MCLLTAHFSKLKSVILLLCNLEAISSNFIPVKFSGHMVCVLITAIILYSELSISTHCINDVTVIFVTHIFSKDA